MRVKQLAPIALGLALSLAASDLWGEEEAQPEEAKASTTAELVLGEYWHAADISKGDLEGKVVLFVIWGS